MAHGPLVADFVEKSDQVLLSGDVGWAHLHFNREQKARKRLQAAYAKGNLNIDNIEDLFDVYETASLLRRLSDMNPDEVAALPRDLRFVIMRTLERSITYPIVSPEEYVRAPIPYAAFVELLQQIRRNRRLNEVAVISFNYDLCLDYACAVAGIDLDYGWGLGGASRKSPLTLLKLHGSLNWSADNPDKRIRPEKVVPMAASPLFRRLGVRVPVERPIDTMELLHGPDAWGERPIPEPFIIPPTWSKGKSYDWLTAVWRSASAALSTAENVFVIGYSLSPSDQFFRSFYALSAMSDAIVSRFWVFDPSATVTERYESLVGPAIWRRGRFRHELLNFSQAIRFLAETLELDVDVVTDLLRNSLIDVS